MSVENEKVFFSSFQVTQVLAWVTRLVMQRLVITTVLFGTALYISVGGEAALFGPVLPVLWVIIVTSYLFSGAYFLIRRYFEVSRGRWLAATQVLYDVLLSTGLVYISGGVDSFFTPLYCVNICFAACILGKHFGYLVSGICTLSFSMLVVLQYYGFLPEMLGAKGLIGRPNEARVLISIFSNMLLFNVVALIVGYVVKKLSVTEENLRLGQERIENLTDLNRSILENISSGVIAITAKGAILSFNYAAEKILGVEAINVVGKDIGAILPEVKNRLKTLGDREEESSYPRVLQWNLEQVTTKGVNRFLGLAISRLRGHGFIIALQDLTDFRKMADEIRKSEQMAAIGRLSASIAHEIRNPLASISGSIEIMKSESRSDENRRLMDIALRETARLNKIVTGFLDFARPVVPQIKDCDLLALLEEVSIFFQEGNKKVEVDCRSTNGFVVKVDRDQMKQVFWNLFQNSVDANEVGARIKVEAMLEVGNKDRVNVFFKDFGAGIPDDISDKVFDPFFTTKKEGYGLGLATVSKIIESNGGNIELSQNDAPGAVFRISLGGYQRM